MRDYIIQRPELQTPSQKFGSFFIACVSWLLWVYFLFPLFTLGGWLLGVKEWSHEIRWFGGYKSLVDLLLLYLAIIGAIFFIWFIWFFKLVWFKQKKSTELISKVHDDELSEKFQIDIDLLTQSKAGQKLTVFFDEHANIKGVIQDG
jgi:biofilm PGA synthesis protein PgaD